METSIVMESVGVKAQAHYNKLLEAKPTTWRTFDEKGVGIAPDVTAQHPDDHRPVITGTGGR
jgi:hypothetical protein